MRLLLRTGKGVQVQRNVEAAGMCIGAEATYLTVSLKPLNDPLRSKVLASEALCSAKHLYCALVKECRWHVA